MNTSLLLNIYFLFAESYLLLFFRVKGIKTLEVVENIVEEFHFENLSLSKELFKDIVWIYFFLFCRGCIFEDIFWINFLVLVAIH